MAVSRDALHKVGFSPEQSAALQNLAQHDVNSLVRRARFPRHQAEVLKGSTLDLQRLIRVGKFSRAKAELILAL